MSETPSVSKATAAAPTSLFGYEVVDFLGEGAGSLIYAVSDPATKQVYALKHVVVQTEKQGRFAEQLVNEYEVGKHIHDDLVRRVFDLKVNRTMMRKITEAALVMELVDGTPLDQLPSPTIAQTAQIFSQVAKALHAVHQAGFVDCDLKPNNIMLRSDGSIKLIDLGQACPPLTVKQRIQGTPDFISPEQVKCEPVTFQTDVFNFGATLYWALSGKKVPTLYTLKKSDNSILFDGLIPSPAEVNPQVPLPMSNLVMECIRTNASKRPSDLLEVSRRLELMGMSAARHAGSNGASG